MCKSGASLLFVLGIMLFLMAIGISTMAAASANQIFIMKQNEFNEILALDKSIQENIMFSLQAEPDNPLLREDYLGYHFAMYIFNEFEKYTPPPSTDPDTIGPASISSQDGEFDIQIDGQPVIAAGNNRIDWNIAFSFPFFFKDSLITVRDPEPSFPMSENTETNKRVPRTATMSARMEVTVEVIMRQGTADERRITSVAVYEYSGGILSDEVPGEAPDGNQWGGGDVYPDVPMNFVPARPAVPGDPGTPAFPGGYGTWELVRYEVIDR